MSSLKVHCLLTNTLYNYLINLLFHQNKLETKLFTNALL